MSDIIKAIAEVSNYILVSAFGSGVAILVKRFFQHKPPGLQSLLDICLIKFCDAYMIQNLLGNLSYGTYDISFPFTVFTELVAALK